MTIPRGLTNSLVTLRDHAIECIGVVREFLGIDPREAFWQRSSPEDDAKVAAELRRIRERCDELLNGSRSGPLAGDEPHTAKSLRRFIAHARPRDERPPLVFLVDEQREYGRRRIAETFGESFAEEDLFATSHEVVVGWLRQTDLVVTELLTLADRGDSVGREYRMRRRRLDWIAAKFLIDAVNHEHDFASRQVDAEWVATDLFAQDSRANSLAPVREEAVDKGAMTATPRKAKREEKNAERYKKLAEALFLRREHPEWSDAEIARRIGVSPSTLCKWREWQVATETNRSGSGPRRGFVRRGDDGSRDVDAFD